jgi:ketosteroid isomerase-like protein
MTRSAEETMSQSNIQQMLDGLCRAAEARDGKAFASYFAEDGTYHDDFYGSFVGRERVAELINDWFYKDARALRWDMIEPAHEAGRLYVRYVFSYESTLPEARGARAMFEGVSIMSLRDGKIAEYREIINCGTAFADMHFHPERMFAIFSRKASAMKAKPEVQRHLPP